MLDIHKNIQIYLQGEFDVDEIDIRWYQVKKKNNYKEFLKINLHFMDKSASIHMWRPNEPYGILWMNILKKYWCYWWRWCSSKSVMDGWGILWADMTSPSDIKWWQHRDYTKSIWGKASQFPEICPETETPTWMPIRKLVNAN